MSATLVPRASALVVSRRPTFLEPLCDMLERQDRPFDEVVLLLHGLSPGDLPAQVRRRFECLGPIAEAPTSWPLGRCLNDAAARASGDVLAKVDDDDLYAPGYLAEALATLELTGADVVGKAEFFMWEAGDGSLWLVYPGAGRRPQTFVAGGTIVFRRDLACRPGFRPLAVGSDTAFLQDCVALGHAVHASSRRHYLYRRFGAGGCPYGFGRRRQPASASPAIAPGSRFG